MSRKKAIYLALYIVFSISVIPASFVLFDLHLNLTASMPTGIYRNVDKEIEIGDIVVVCGPTGDANFEQYMDDSGRCENGHQPLIKYVGALGSDSVEIQQDGIKVNGRLIGETKPLIEDSEGRPMQIASAHVLDDTNVFVYALHPSSFDSRYFGSLSISDVQSVVMPLWIWD